VKGGSGKLKKASTGDCYKRTSNGGWVKTIEEKGLAGVLRRASRKTMMKRTAEKKEVGGKLGDSKS